MSSPRTISVLGSTGVQGASILHYLLANTDPATTHLRALTHSAPSSAASALPPLSSHPNLTVHQVDILSKSTLITAFTGSQVVFGTTNSQDPRFSKQPLELEIQAIKTFVDACVEANVELLIHSSLADMGPMANRVHDFAAKSEGMKYARKIAENSGGKLKVVFVQMGWYYNNFFWWHPPVVNKEDGVVEFEIPGADPNAKAPWVGTYTDLGPIVKAIIDNPEPYLGREITLAGDVLNLHEIVEIYSKVTGQPTRIVSKMPIVDPNDTFEGSNLTEEQRQFAYFMAIYNSAKYLDDYKPGSSIADELISKTSKGKMTTWEEWLRQTGFDATKEGFGEGVKNVLEKWGGRKYF
ncbi:hypothetical protein BDZ91DRAFT_786579 [Kalaharituber pfeilii]|nr:hypothetical protein BDZ91DRAFT_786579 [Kalaharituber pfeilii]